ncbi:DNA repair protein REV1 [Trichinella pseudospiralis]|uniref:DNA repair protein REV1 n=1 Tax=Trichinella pseudospiralis TaxID=6337 RepID=A0A0V1EZ25_TRIPS|nr:DNA repair protein REV1 [Trichinella pseudospiralis]KRZ46398.1 DNA repair protein REV1 [Trichinella pseudospiralis]
MFFKKYLMTVKQIYTMGSEDESNDRKESEWKGWSDYMSTKKEKLAKQFEESDFQSEPKKNIFAGISIYVNGYTDPPADQLKRLILQYGGKYDLYNSMKITHVIASVLPHVKIKKLVGSEKIMKPDWILDSIAAGRLLPENDYRLYFGGSNLDDKMKSEKDVKADAEDFDAGQRQAKRRHIDCTDYSNYFETFYKHSRLHFISTTAQKMKSFVQQLQNCEVDFDKNRQELINSILKMEPCCSSTPIDMHEQQSYIMHLDMDCFFVSASLQNYPLLRGKPVAVAHSNHSDQAIELDSWAEIASCNYEARMCGVRNGMRLGSALELCPNLKTISYDFERYAEISQTIYSLVGKYTRDLEAVSCDEMFVDLKELCFNTGIRPLQFASFIREEIFKATGCTSSVGIGTNKLVARLATKVAKPNGQVQVLKAEVSQFMKATKVADLPGVGMHIWQKLCERNIFTCEDLLRVELGQLQRDFGKKTAIALQQKALGRDDSCLKAEIDRKSISCHVNYGIRFTTLKDAQGFLEKQSEELAKRMSDNQVEAKHITLKLMIRAPNASLETKKYMGHGVCNTVSHSVTLANYTSDANSIAKEVLNLFKHLNATVSDIRGIALSVKKLKKLQQTKEENSNSLMKAFLKQPTKQCDKDRPDQEQPSCEINLKRTTAANDKPANAENMSSSVISKLNNVFEVIDKENYEKCKTLIYSWALQNEIPISADISYVKSYFLKLIDRLYLEKVESLLKLFKQAVGKRKSLNDIFHSIREEVQDAVVRRYGFLLDI